ncbi:MAG: preprotein translocase subunit SecE [Bacilli bacterium]
MRKIKEFFAGVVSEVKKSHFPKGKELAKYSAICIAMIVFFALFFFGLDVSFAFLRGLIK